MTSQPTVPQATLSGRVPQTNTKSAQKLSLLDITRSQSKAINPITFIFIGFRRTFEEMHLNIRPNTSEAQSFVFFFVFF